MRVKPNNSEQIHPRLLNIKFLILMQKKSCRLFNTSRDINIFLAQFDITVFNLYQILVHKQINMTQCQKCPEMPSKSLLTLFFPLRKINYYSTVTSTNIFLFPILLLIFRSIQSIITSLFFRLYRLEY